MKVSIKWIFFLVYSNLRVQINKQDFLFSPLIKTFHCCNNDPMQWSPFPSSPHFPSLSLGFQDIYNGWILCRSHICIWFIYINPHQMFVCIYNVLQLIIYNCIENNFTLKSSWLPSLLMVLFSTSLFLNSLYFYLCIYNLRTFCLSF